MSRRPSYRFFILFMIAVLFSGCSTPGPVKEQTPTPSLTPQPTVNLTQATQTPSPGPTRTPVDIPMPTLTLMPAVTQTTLISTMLPTATLGILPSPISVNHSQQTPIKIDPSIHPGTWIPGRLVEGCGDGFCSLEFQDGKIIQTPFLPGLAQTLAGGPAISPDDKWLAYLEKVPGQTDPKKARVMKIVSGTRHFQRQIAWWPEWDGNFYWLGNKGVMTHVLIGSYPSDQATPAAPIKPTTFVLVNPFTGDYQSIGDRNLGESDTGPEDSNFLLSFNPSLTHVAYYEDCCNTSYNALASTSWGDTIWDAPGDSQSRLLPVWSPDGTQVVFPDGLYMVYANGGGARRINLARDYYPKGSNFLIRSIKWSPGGQTLAFWLNVHYPGDETQIFDLVLVDVKTLKLKDLGLPSYGDLPPALFWSADSQHLAVVSDNDIRRETGEDLVVDLTQGTAFPIPSLGVMVGWMDQ